MRTINCWRDLEPYGIDLLTGEACGFALRGLCDVTERGKTLLERFFGGTIAIRKDSEWNGGSKDDPHVGSIMLPYAILPELAGFILAVTGHEERVAVTLSGAAAFDTGELVCLQLAKTGEERAERLAIYENRYEIKRYLRKSPAPGTGDRNEHMASGRVE